jgi:D-3-phosphoglycerate dehydrogenase
MSDPVEPLILDLLEWIGRAPRPYAEVMEAWRTSCPRLPVWEEANARGYLEQRHPAGSAAVVAVTAAGRQRLAERAAARPGARDHASTSRSPSAARSRSPGT